MKIAFALLTLCFLAACEETDRPYYSHHRRGAVYRHDAPYRDDAYYGRSSRRSDSVYYDDRPVYRGDDRDRYYSTAPRSRVIIGY